MNPIQKLFCASFLHSGQDQLGKYLRHVREVAGWNSEVAAEWEAQAIHEFGSYVPEMHIYMNTSTSQKWKRGQSPRL